jgi:putative drug exporter of the RND superfamily
MLHLGETDTGALPTSTQARQSYDIMSAGCGVGSNGPILIAAAPSSGTTSTSDPRLARLRRGIETTLGVKVITPPMVNRAGTAAVFTVVSDYALSHRKTGDLVRTLRVDSIPTVTRGQHMEVDVGGTTAGYIDLASQISSKLPTVVAIVLSLSFVLLALAYRSVLVPLKAVIANLLSVGAAFAVLTYVFDHHWSATAIGEQGPIPIASFVPLMMFAILFGLSMDYEAFLMTRIRER